MVKKNPSSRPPATSSVEKTAGIRLNKFLSMAGLGSRRHCEEYIIDRRITVNGQTVTELGQRIIDGDIVKLDRQTVTAEKMVFYLLNKPVNMITSLKDPEGRRTVAEFFTDMPLIKPVGRLDRNSTGTLILTNDGELHYRLTHPKYQIPRVYNVYLDRKPRNRDLAKVERGVILDDGKTARGKILESEDNHLKLELREGQNREIRRIFNQLGYQVKQLDRESFAGIGYGDLPQGKFRELRKNEVLQLRKMCGLKAG